MHRTVKELLEKLKHTDPKPDVIPIVRYKDEETFKLFRNPESGTLQQQTEVLEEALRELRRRGYRAIPVDIDAAEYRKWLGEDLNLTENRALYISLKMREVRSKLKKS